jgi:hypothetical protein
MEGRKKWVSYWSPHMPAQSRLGGIAVSLMARICAVDGASANPCRFKTLKCIRSINRDLQSLRLLLTFTRNVFTEMNSGV